MNRERFGPLLVPLSTLIYTASHYDTIVNDSTFLQNIQLCYFLLLRMNLFHFNLQQNLRTNEVENLRTGSLKPQFISKKIEISQITSRTIKGTKPYPLLVEVTSFGPLHCVLCTVFCLRICVILNVSVAFFVLLGISNACSTCVVLDTYQVCCQTFFFYAGNEMRNRRTRNFFAIFLRLVPVPPGSLLWMKL